jgi:hypothetical protein
MWKILQKIHIFSQYVEKIDIFYISDKQFIMRKITVGTAFAIVKGSKIKV